MAKPTNYKVGARRSSRMSNICCKKKSTREICKIDGSYLDLTNFEYVAQAMTGNESNVNLQKLTCKNS